MPLKIIIPLVVLILIIVAFCICFYRQITIFVVAITGKKRIQKKLYKECKANDLLILNDIWLPMGDNKYKYIDTIIFGNKYIYIVKEIKQVGEVKISMQDQKWRVIFHNKLALIDNPFIFNDKVISYLVNEVAGLEFNDLKSVAILAKTCTFKNEVNDINQLVFSENDAIKRIMEFENKSNDDIIDPKEIERYCKAFYNEGLEAEKLIKKYKKKNK